MITADCRLNPQPGIDRSHIVQGKGYIEMEESCTYYSKKRTLSVYRNQDPHAKYSPLHFITPPNPIYITHVTNNTHGIRKANALFQLTVLTTPKSSITNGITAFTETVKSTMNGAEAITVYVCSSLLFLLSVWMFCMRCYARIKLFFVPMSPNATPGIEITPPEVPPHAEVQTKREPNPSYSKLHEHVQLNPLFKDQLLFPPHDPRIYAASPPTAPPPLTQDQVRVRGERSPHAKRSANGKSRSRKPFEGEYTPDSDIGEFNPSERLKPIKALYGSSTNISMGESNGQPAPPAYTPPTTAVTTLKRKQYYP